MEGPYEVVATLRVSRQGPGGDLSGLLLVQDRGSPSLNSHPVEGTH